MVRIRIKIIDVFSRDVPSDMPHIGIKYETQSTHKIGEPKDEIDYRLIKGTIYVSPIYLGSLEEPVLDYTKIIEVITKDIKKKLPDAEEVKIVKKSLENQEIFVEV